MKSIEDLYKYFENYKNGNIHPKEKQEFEVKLKNDKDFAQEYKDFLITLKAIDIYNTEKIKTELKNNANSQNWYSRLSHFTMTKAAVFLFLIISITSLFIIDRFGTVSAEELFAEYFTNTLIESNSRDLIPNSNNEYEQALTYYKSKNYTKAIPELEKILKSSPEKNRIALYLGVCYLGNGQINQAKKVLIPIINNNSKYIIDAKWYLALAYLVEEDFKTSKNLLKEIISSNSSIKVKAEKLNYYIDN